MKLGLVLECDSSGADELVLTCFARRLAPGIHVQSTALGSKKELFNNGTEAAAELVESSKCDLVLIAWDLKPYWGKVAPNCEAEADELREKIKSLAPATAARIKLLCLTWELETWLIADPRAVNAHLSTPAHRSNFRCNSPLTKDDAKAFLDGECRKHRGRSRRYVDFREAIQIAQLIPDTSKIKDVPSFQRFSKLVSGATDKFKQAGNACDDLAHQAFRMGRP